MLGYYTGPPDENFYTICLRGNGTEMTNTYGMLVYDSSRGTNQVETVHKGPIAIGRGWNTGVNMQIALLGKRRHCHNQRVAKMRRLGYPKLSHYDIWLIRKLQLLHMSNHGTLLHPNVPYPRASDNHRRALILHLLVVLHCLRAKLR